MPNEVEVKRRSRRYGGDTIAWSKEEGGFTHLKLGFVLTQEEWQHLERVAYPRNISVLDLLEERWVLIKEVICAE